MQKLQFSTHFLSAMMVCRYIAYGCFAAIALIRWWPQSEGLLGLLYFGLTPVLMHFALKHIHQRIILIGLHLVEGCALCAVLEAGELHYLVMVSAIVVLASNTALWGARLLPVFALACSGGIGVSIWWMQSGRLATPSLGPPDALDALAVGVGLGFVLMICALAHSQAQQLVRWSVQLRSQKKHLLRYLPPDLSTHLASENPLRQIWCSVVFIDLVGFSQVTQTLPAQAMATLLNQFLSAVNTHVEQWDGQVSKFLGDGVLCVFPLGTPILSGAAQKNAALQAVRCVLLLNRVFSDLNTTRQIPPVKGFAKISVTVGVASGYCCTGHWGGARRLDYTVVGQPVNLAQRLQSASKDVGGLLLDQTTAQLVADGVSGTQRYEVNLKGLGLTPGFAVVGHVMS